jgi:cell division protease FtsH
MSQDNPLKDSLPKVKASGWRNKNFFLILFLILIGLLMLKLWNEGQVKPVNRTQFLAWINDSTTVITKLKLQKATDGIMIIGERKMSSKEMAEVPNNSFLAGTKRGGEVTTVPFRSHMLEITNEMIDSWEKKKNFQVEVVHEDVGWLEHIFAFLPLVLVLVLFWMMMARQGGGAGGRGLFSFGKSKARLLDSGRQRTTFADVAGCDEAKQDLEEIVNFLKNPKKYDQLGGRIPKGALLVGPPGTGKTLLGRAVAGEAGVPFFSMSGSDFVEMFVGVGASRVRDLFETGKKHAPCILFIDEIDAVGRQRGAGLGGGHDEREQTLNQLLVEMDGFAPNEGVILIAATNRPDVLDKALLRPGRFDRQVVVNLPDLKGREEILWVHIKKRKVPMASDVDVASLARGTSGLSGADLENLVNESALLAARYGQNTVSHLDFEEAREKLWMGAERRSLIMTEEEKRHTAYHEAGHALLTLLCPSADPLHKVTIIPRGRALGLTWSQPERDKVSFSLENAHDMIAILMAGRLAELMMFNHQSTGASNDIERATGLARKMVSEWGFTEDIGPVSYSRGGDEVFLGREISRPKEMSEAIALKIDVNIRRIIDEQVERVRQLLTEHKDKLIAIGEALYEHENLDREEIDRVMKGETLQSTKKSRQYISRRQRDLAEAGKAVEPPPVPPSVPPEVPPEVPPVITPEGDSAK